MQRVYVGIQSHFITRLPEWIMSTTMAGQGLWLLQSGLTFESSRAYRPLKIIATEAVWGQSALVIGSIWLAALFINGTFVQFRRLSPWLRAACSLATAFYMTEFASGMWIGNPLGDGWLMHTMLGTMAGAYCAIIAREVSRVDREAKRWPRRNQHTSRAG